MAGSILERRLARAEQAWLAGLVLVQLILLLGAAWLVAGGRWNGTHAGLPAALGLAAIAVSWKRIRAEVAEYVRRKVH